MKVVVINKKIGNKTEYNNATIIDNSPIDFKIGYNSTISCRYSYRLYDWDVVKEVTLPTLPEAIDYINNLIEKTKISSSDIVDNVEVKYLKVLIDNLEV